jgi:predicted GNAT superfamily acetyltransferase
METRLCDIERIEDFKRIPEIEQDAWGFGDFETEPHHLMTRVKKYGGLVRGLFLDHTMIGFSYAVIGKWKDEFFLYSHMVAIRQVYQSRGYGFLLKQDQRKEALRLGYRIIRWNFDPLEALNVYFNFHKLGVISCEYERDIYGTGETGLHRGLNTDRLIAEWFLDSDRVKTAMSRKREPVILDTIPASESRKNRYIEIPLDIRAVKHTSIETAEVWRSRTREQIETAFAGGFIADGVVFSEDRKQVFIHMTKQLGDPSCV